MLADRDDAAMLRSSGSPGSTPGRPGKVHRWLGRPEVHRQRGIAMADGISPPVVQMRFRRGSGANSELRSQGASPGLGGAFARLGVVRGATGRRLHGGAEQGYGGASWGTACSGCASRGKSGVQGRLTGPIKEGGRESRRGTMAGAPVISAGLGCRFADRADHATAGVIPNSDGF